MNLLLLAIAILALAVLAAGALLAAPLWAGRLVAPRLTLALLRAARRLAPKLLRGESGLRLLVTAGNRYFQERFRSTPFGQRVLFLPWCLKPRQCPAPVDRQEGLACQSQCSGCPVGELRAEALSLGYQRVFIVPSSRLLPGRGMFPSHHFIQDKLHRLKPGAALGVTCPRYLRERLLPRFNVDSKGLANQGGSPTALHGVLLFGNCRLPEVDWQALRGSLRLSAAP